MIKIILGLQLLFFSTAGAMLSIGATRYVEHCRIESVAAVLVNLSPKALGEIKI